MSTFSRLAQHPLFALLLFLLLLSLHLNLSRPITARAVLVAVAWAVVFLAVVATLFRL
jgi:hypothetical protein